jgi:hypothetical protein
MLTHLDLASVWLNHAGPKPRAQDLAGHPVMVHFWSRTSIEGVQDAHAMTALARRETTRGLIVLGVHVPAPGSRTDPRVVRSVLLREGIKHPIALDTQGRIAHAMSIRRLPTTLLFAADGTPAAQLAGSQTQEILDRTMRNIRPHELPAPPASLNPVPECEQPSLTRLCFPSAVCAQTPSVGRQGWVFIADTAAHRVVATSWPDDHGSCQTVWTLGDGIEGSTNDTPVRFHSPSGLAFDAERQILYIAEAGGHRIRRVRLHDRAVSTLLGTGNPGTDRRGGGSGTNQPINAPIGLALDPTRNKLFIAMAGLHQVWSLDLTTLVARPIAGCAEPGIVDGPADDARLAQPCAVLFNPERTHLLVSDAAGPALRQIDLAARTVRTIIGTPTADQGATLSVIGHRDGTYPDARMALPAALTPWIDSSLAAVLDADNNTLRLVDPVRRSIITPGAACPLHEPLGISLSAHLASTTTTPRLFIADTAAHRIVQIDPDTHVASELRVRHLARPGLVADRIPAHAERAAMNVPLSAPLSLEVICEHPADLRLSTLERPVLRITTAHRDETLDEVLIQQTFDGRSATVTIPRVEAHTLLLVECSIALENPCDSRCIPLVKAWRVRFGSDGGQPRLRVQFSGEDCRPSKGT